MKVTDKRSIASPRSPFHSYETVKISDFLFVVFSIERTKRRKPRYLALIKEERKRERDEVIRMVGKVTRVQQSWADRAEIEGSSS